MNGALVVQRLPAPPEGPDGWGVAPSGTAGPPPPPIEPPDEPPSGGGQGPVPRRGPGPRRVAVAVGGVGTLMLVVALLSLIWPALAVLVLAGAGAALLMRGGLRWAWQALRSPGRAGLRRRVLRGVLSVSALGAAFAALAAPAAVAWALGVLMALLLASLCAVALVSAVRGRRRRLVLGVGGAVGLAVATVLVLVPAAAVALAATTVVAVLSISGVAMLVAARAVLRATVPG